jgi:hypothetical protein
VACWSFNGSGHEADRLCAGDSHIHCVK